MDDREEEYIYRDHWLDFQLAIIKNSTETTFDVFLNCGSFLDGPAERGYLMDVYPQTRVKRFDELFVDDDELLDELLELYMDDGELFFDDLDDDEAVS